MELTVTWVAAILFNLIGWGSLCHFAWIVRNWPEARARIVGNISEYSKGGGERERRIIHFAQLEFSARGMLYKVKGGIGRAEPWTVGETVQLHYKPSHPEHVLDFNFWQRMAFSAAFIFFGGLCAAVLMGYAS